MMMTLGTFAFGMDTAPYQQLQRSMTWRYGASERVGARAARQYLGPGEDTVRISGVLAPEITGDPASLDVLREMAADGEPLPLVDGRGRVYGAYTITAIEETSAYLFADGTPRRIEFAITLERDEDPEAQA